MASKRRIVPQSVGVLAAGSVVAGYTALLSSVAGRGVTLVFTNTLNADVMVSLDAGTTDFIVLPAGQGMVLDIGANGCEYSGTVSVKRSGTPTTGSIWCGVIREN